MEEVYIVEAKRTPVGRFQGSLKSMAASDLGAVALKSLIASCGAAFDPEEIIFGQVLTAGCGQAPVRQAALKAGIKQSVPVVSIGKVCGSGLQSVILATRSLRLGDAQAIIAGGQESMSQAPYLSPGARDGFRMGHKELIDSMIKDGLWDPYNNMHMGQCAELCAKEFKLDRAQQDEFAKSSYEKARTAMANGSFTNEIATVEVTAFKQTTLVAEDEEPQASNLDKMSALKPAFDKEGSITAANASKINDGAAALMLVTGTAVKKFGLKPMARIVSYAGHAQDPLWFTTAPVEAMKKSLQKANLKVSDIDLFEINEAFAVVTLAAMKALEIPADRVNVNGGAIAIGHPIGASGARILTTLVHALKQRNKNRGLATLCIGGGEAVSLVVDRQGCN